MKGSLNKFYTFFFNANRILESDRLAWIDYAKGLTIILVVYHHSFLTLVNSDIKVNAWLINANLSVYSFRMPMFFMLSGLFIKRGLEKRGVKQYVFNRAKLLLYPYILWTSIQVTSKLFFSQYMHHEWSLNSYLVIFYQPNATAQFWYLITLFNTAILYVILSGLFKVHAKYQFLLGVFLYMLSPLLSFNSMIQDTTRFYVYLVFGSLICGFILKRENIKYFSSIRLFIPLLFLMFLSQYYLFKHQYLYSLEMNFMNDISVVNVIKHLWGMLKFTGIVLVGCLFVLNLCMILQEIGKMTFIRVVGYHSLYIYILHVMIAVGCRIIFVNLLHYDNAFIILPIQITAGMILSVMIFNICRHLNMTFLFEYNLAQFKKFATSLNIYPKFQRA